MLCSSIVPLSQVIQKGNNHRKRSFFCSFFVASENTRNSEPPILGITRNIHTFFFSSFTHTNEKKKTTLDQKRKENGKIQFLLVATKERRIRVKILEEIISFSNFFSSFVSAQKKNTRVKHNGSYQTNRS